jgi:taurine dioxygenase
MPALSLATNRYERIGVRSASGALGAEITGVDLSKPHDDAVFAEIRRAFHDHLVIFFRDQTMSPADHVAFTERFGAVEAHPLGSRRGLGDYPGVMVLENRPGKLGPRNDFWHSDISFGEEPPAASVLYAIEITEGRSDTMFCNMYAAWDSLSPGLRQMLRPLTAVHTAERLVREVPSRLSVKEAPPGVTHPVVRTHPETGRNALYINPHYTWNFTGMTPEESWPLLDYLTREATKHENIYRHRWQAGDLLMWDNRCTMHYAVRDYDDTMPRFLHRTTAAGSRPFYAGEP